MIVTRRLSCGHEATFSLADEMTAPPTGLKLPERWYCMVCRETVEVREPNPGTPEPERPVDWDEIEEGLR